MILDEVDEGIDKCCALDDIENKHALGMMSIRYAVKSFFLSASYDNFHLAFLRDCFKGTKPKVFKGV